MVKAFAKWPFRVAGLRVTVAQKLHQLLIHINCGFYGHHSTMIIFQLFKEVHQKELQQEAKFP